jgi:uncharacterized protein (TIGR02145 family)
MVTGYEQGGLLYDPNGLPFLNTLSEIKNGYGYWVKVTNPATLSVIGEPIPPTFAINLTTGWNLVAYWPAETITPEVAFAQLISLGVLQTVTGYEQGGKFFDPNGPAFLNTLTEIKNGFGYWVKVSADFNGFTYPLSWACGDIFTDSRDGRVYTTVQIGTQCWMKQNLNIGTRIDGANIQTNNGTIEKYCNNNLETNCDIYGGLYQWDEMMQYSITQGVQGICPSGWHLPTDAEWTVLTTYLGGESVAGGKMKEIGTTHWASPNTGATNGSGFTGLPGGFGSGGNFLQSGYGGFWASSTETDFSNARNRVLYYSGTDVQRDNNNKSEYYSVRCLKGEVTQVSVPSVTTSAISTVTSTSAISGGDVTSDEVIAVIARGVCWSTSQNPTLANSFTTNGTGTGTFTSNIHSLTPGTTYYIRAYATNIVGTAYGNQQSFATLTFQCPSSFSDSRDGKVYTTVQIGTQCWMKQNLNIGTRIDGTSSQTNNGIIEKYCYDNLESNCDIYGGLYQWEEMMQYSTIEGIRGICAEGWHLPTDTEWTALTDYVSSQPEYICESNTGYIAKALAAKTNWDNNIGTCAPGTNLATNNATGFTALPGGRRYTDGSFDMLSYGGYCWSSSQYDASGAWRRNLGYNSAQVYRDYRFKSYGFSVRCLKD